MYLSEQEQKFIRYLADCFENGRINMTRELVCKELEFSELEYESQIRAMESLGVVENVNGASGIHATWFEPSFYAVDLARQLDATEEAERQPDFVEQIQNRIKRNPIAAWVIIGFIFLAFVAPIYSMLVDILQRLGWVAVPQ